MKGIGLFGEQPQSPLARRLIVAIILVSSAITLCLTAVQLYGEYRSELDDIQATFLQIEQVHLKSLTQSLWATNEGDLKLQVEGIARVPNLEYIAVHEGGRLWAQVGRRASRAVVERQYAMTYVHRGGTLELGTLTVVTGLDAVYRRLIKQALTVLASNALKTLVVAGFAFALFHWLVNRHLLAIARNVRGLDLRGRAPPLILARAAGRRADELDEVTAAINVMHEQVYSTLAALRESSERLRLAVQASNIGLWDWDLRSNRIAYSREWKGQLGHEEDEIGEEFGEWERRVHPEDLAPMLERMQRYLARPEGAYEAEFRMRHKNGAWLWIYARGEVFRDSDGKPERMMGCHVDITQRKQAETVLAAHARQQAVVADLGRLALAGVDFQRLFDQAVARVAQTFGVEYCEVLERLPDGGALKLVAGVGWKEGLVGQTIVEEGRDSLAGFTLFCAGPVIVEDLQTETRFRASRLLRDHGVVSGLSVMIGEPENPFGVISAHTTRRRVYTPDNVHFLQSVANVLAEAIQHKRAADEAQEANRRLQALSARLLQVQEQERATIARELHDEVGGVLTAVKLNLLSLRRKRLSDAGEAALADGLTLVDSAIQTVRSRSLDLRPAVLDDLGLIPALKWYCARQAQRAGVAIELALDAIDLKPAPQLESTCFRIVQESVTNALRHAKARRIQVTLHRDEDSLVLEIADDGTGFAPAAARRRGLAGESSGLLGMEERANLMGGRLGIDSAPGAGTRVWVKFSLPQEAHA